MLNWIRKNPTALYALVVAALPLVATFVSFDQEKVLGVVSALLVLVAGGAVRKASLKATAEAREEVPDGYVYQAETFPSVDYVYPKHDMETVDFLSEDL